MPRRSRALRGDGETRVKVTIFGGGVTGLSAAHELIERGFDVTVVERREDPFVKDRCQIGGMARTQWSRFPAVEVFDRDAANEMRRARPPIGLARSAAWAVGEAQIEEDAGPERDYVEIRFEEDSAELVEAAQRRLDAVIERLKEYVERYLARDEHGHPAPLILRGTEKILIEGSRTSGEDAGLSLARAKTVRDAMHRILDLPLPDEFQSPNRRQGENKFRYETYISIRYGDFEDILCRDKSRPVDRQQIVTIRVAESAFPGEHGYRYFPAFYHHLFDTMRRIPITNRERVPDEEKRRLEEARNFRDYRRKLAIEKGRWAGPLVDEPLVKERELNPAIQTGRTVYENVLPTELHSFAQADGEAPVVLSRRRPRSLKELLEVLRAFQEKMGLELADLARYQMKLLEYMTSCGARREQYEGVAWNGFVGTEGFSEAFGEAMSVWPQALVGMRAGEIDARTAGNITVQILLDQLLDFGFVDGTLNDATSPAWLDHWGRYLDSEGVDFVRDSLDRIELGENGSPSFVTRSAQRWESDYYVLALPVEEMHRIATDLRDRLHDDECKRWYTGTDLERVTELMRGWDRKQLEVPNPTDGPLRHLSGIQYFLEHDFRLVRGHTYYPSSPWALTSISQAQFRSVRPLLRDEYRGVLSVDIGNWQALGTHLRKPAWQCTPDELAHEIWDHIDDATRRVDRNDRSRILEGLPKPVWYHIDDEILFAREDFDKDFDGDRTAAGVALNRSPYLVNLPGAWARRPGGEPDQLGHYAYDLLFADCANLRGVVLAGTYMKTHSRLVTMESANESARHAVNRILTDSLERKEERRVRQYCQIFPLEERELDDLSILKDLDAKLCERKLPHLFQILDVYGMLGRFEGGTGLGIDQVGLVGRLIDEILRSFAGGGLDRLRGLGIGSEVIQALRRIVEGRL